MDEYKFAIGSYVKLLGTVEATSDSWGRLEERRYIVVEQTAQHCYGGLQRHYLCRGVEPSGRCSNDYIRFVESEIRQSRPFSEDPKVNPPEMLSGLRAAVEQLETKVSRSTEQK